MNILRPIVWLAFVSAVLPMAVPAQTPPPPAQASAPAGPTFKQEELDSMLAPIALYPDALLSQVLMASTYPLEIVEAARWAKANPNVKGQAVDDALQNQTWDPSVKSLVAFPDVLSRMNQDLTWTQKIGDAFLAQQDQVMDTVQNLRQKAQAAGYLSSNEQQTVDVQTDNNKQYIVIQPANPQVVYVPVYQPTVVYGAWWYPSYPPYYPPYWGAGGAFVRGFFWGAGVAAGAALWGGFGWNNHNVNINVNRYNTYNRTNITNNTWQHNNVHRGAVPYRDNGSRQKYGNYDRQAAQSRDQFRGRDSGLGGQGLNDRAGLNNAQNRGAGNLGSGTATSGNRAGNAGGGTARPDLSTRSGGAAQRPANGGGGASRDFGGSDRGAFNPSGGGAQARSASSRGNASVGSAHGGGGGGAARGGGGGGARGGGGGGGRGR
jgi:hypothetical protein